MPAPTAASASSSPQRARRSREQRRPSNADTTARKPRPHSKSKPEVYSSISHHPPPQLPRRESLPSSSAATQPSHQPAQPHHHTANHSSSTRERLHTHQPPPAPTRDSARCPPPPPNKPRRPLTARASSAPLVPQLQQLPIQRPAKNGQVGGPRPPNVPADDDDYDDEEISQDPFFQRYHITTAAAAAAAASPPKHHHPRRDRRRRRRAADDSAESSSDSDGPLSFMARSPPPQPTPPDLSASPRLSAQARSPNKSWLEPPPPASMALSDHLEVQPSDLHDINIGVVGDAGAGKTLFIDRAFDLRSRPGSRTATRKMSIDGIVYTVRLLEMPIAGLDLNRSDDHISWPNTMEGATCPRIDGALLLYDVTRQESLAQVPGMLSVAHKAGLPCVLVGCKCDRHPAHRQVDPAVVEQRAKALVGDVAAFQSADGSPESQRLCLSVMLRAILASRQDQAKHSPSRRRANSSALRTVSPRPNWARKHERASSEFSGSRLRIQSDNNAGARAKPHHHAGTPQQSFLDLEESPGYESYDSDAAESSDYEPSVISVMPSDENGYTFDQLVDRLLAQPLSKQDNKFVSIFLALYRKFAAPSQLLDAITKRFDAIEHDKKPEMIRLGAQLRHLGVIEQWLSTYPGDFAHPMTRSKISQFVGRLNSNRIFALASKEILADLEIVAEDDDTEWACSDRNREGAKPGKDSNYGTYLDEATDYFSKSSETLTVTLTTDSNETQRGSVQPSRSISTSTSSTSQTMLNAVEAAQRQAKLLVPIPRVSLTKTQWHLLMGESEESIARELTRIDWIMFSSIRPRDLVRHVSLSAPEKRKCKNLDNVDRAIEHFNHLAYWVTNFILLRDKPKHRALMLEKFMKVARELRKLNNYNSLGAVMAGLQGGNVHRLAATRELVTEGTKRDFMKLEILMGTQKSHFAYRLAWENSSGERIMYLPLHRRDLVSAAEGNSTFVNAEVRRASSNALAAMANSGNGKSRNASGEDIVIETPTTAAAQLQVALARGREEKEAPPQGVTGRDRINWKKFAIMGEVIVGMQRAQGVPYPNIVRNDEVRGLVLDVRIIKDDDELYERSTAVEAVGAAGDKQRRLMNWFQR